MQTQVVVEVTWTAVADHNYLVEIWDGGQLVNTATVTEEAISYNGAKAGFNVDKGIGGERNLTAKVYAIRQFDGVQGSPTSVNFTVPAFDEPAPTAPANVQVNIT